MSRKTSNPKPPSAAPVGAFAPTDAELARRIEENGCPYQLGARLGQGGMARVYVGVHRLSGRVAAVKVPTGSPWAHRRFRQEVEVMARFDHPHLMPIIEADPEKRWYAMPLARRSLHDLRDANPFASEDLLRALSSVTGAMMHAHAHGCVHRDASPDNILELDGVGHWVLSDFGIAKAPRGLRRGTEKGERFGTPIFSAPEVHANPPNASPAADAWSIGALASWFTSIRMGQMPSSKEGRDWLELIESTVRQDPAERWSIQRVNRKLEEMRMAGVQLPADQRSPQACIRCHLAAGRDATERCLHCGYVADA